MIPRRDGTSDEEDRDEWIAKEREMDFRPPCENRRAERGRGGRAARELEIRKTINKNVRARADLPLKILEAEEINLVIKRPTSWN